MEHEYWEQRITLASITRAPQCGVGAFIDGNILLIGERPSNPDPHAVHEYPFCSSSGCSGWMNRLLEAEGIDERKLFWVNAFGVRDIPTDLRKIHDQLHPSAVVALGSVAKEACLKVGIDYIGTYHPQYWKRFRSKQRYPLLDLLKFLQKNLPERNLSLVC